MNDVMGMNGAQVSAGFSGSHDPSLNTCCSIVQSTLSPAFWGGAARPGTQAENFCQGVVRHVSGGILEKLALFQRSACCPAKPIRKSLKVLDENCRRFWSC